MSATVSTAANVSNGFAPSSTASASLSSSSPAAAASAAGSSLSPSAPSSSWWSMVGKGNMARNVLALASGVSLTFALIGALQKRTKRQQLQQLQQQQQQQQQHDAPTPSLSMSSVDGAVTGASAVLSMGSPRWLSGLRDCESCRVDVNVDISNEHSLSVTLYQLCYAALWYKFDEALPSTSPSSSASAAMLRRVPPKDFTYRPIHGGITNQLYLCELVGMTNVLVRVYGQKTEEVIDRERENIVVNYLSRQHFGPRIFGRGNNARLEQWLPTVHCLKPDQMTIPSISAAIARRVSSLHMMAVPLDRQPQLWHTLRSWMAKSLAIRFDDNDTKASILAQLKLDEVAIELEALHDGIQSDPVSSSSPVVFCHNDLLCGNLLLEPADGSITLVDFEYGCYSYRGFDIANHFAECCGFDCNWDMFPSRDQQLHFCRSYLLSLSSSSSSSSGVASGVDGIEASALALVHELRPYILASHLFWGVWAVVQARHSLVQFDYIGYAKLRLDAYRLMKSSCWPLVSSSAPPSSS